MLRRGQWGHSNRLCHDWTPSAQRPLFLVCQKEHVFWRPRTHTVLFKTDEVMKVKLRPKSCDQVLEDGEADTGAVWAGSSTPAGIYKGRYAGEMRFSPAVAAFGCWMQLQALWERRTVHASCVDGDVCVCVCVCTCVTAGVRASLGLFWGFWLISTVMWAMPSQ